MKICIITCHDVYNVGAGLQAYALSTYLKEMGHDVRIIDYKPEYLSRQYRLDVVSNPKYDRPVVRQLYLLAKLRSRLKRRHSRKKIEFDAFKEAYLPVTERQYHSFQELYDNPPEADVYIAGSDQIWNPLFENGKDPSFFLAFVKSGRKISYAASFAVDSLSPDIEKAVEKYLKGFNAVSVREKSAAGFLNKIGIRAEIVCDPVFLLNKEKWLNLVRSVSEIKEPYLFVYDFDNSLLIRDMVAEISRRRNLKVVSYFGRHDAELVIEGGPVSFLRTLINAAVVITNSFHATAFSLIFEKEIYVAGRKEAINSRITDLLDDVGLKELYVTDLKTGLIGRTNETDWNAVNTRLVYRIRSSEAYLRKHISVE